MKVVTMLGHQEIRGRIPAAAAQRRKWRDDGQSLLEFAFLLPVLCLLAVGVVELGRAAAFTIAVNNAATAGVEYGSQNEATAQDFPGMVNAATKDGNTSFFATFTVTPANGCICDDGSGVSCSQVTNLTACSGFSCPADQNIVECVQVTTQGTWNSILNYPGLSSAHQANGQAVMRVRR